MSSTRASFARCGQAELLVVLNRAGRGIGGTGRIIAMQSLGWMWPFDEQDRRLVG